MILVLNFTLFTYGNKARNMKYSSALHSKPHRQTYARNVETVAGASL